MSYGNIQHPDITRAEKYGMPEEPTVCCPICGEECDTFYKSDGEIIGCNMCVDVVDAYSDESYEEEDSVFAEIFE